MIDRTTKQALSGLGPCETPALASRPAELLLASQTDSVSPVRFGFAGRRWLGPWQNSQWIAPLQSAVLLIGAFLAARTLLFKGTKLPETAYFSPSILFAMVTHLPSALAVSAAAFFVWQGWSRLRWSELDPGIALKCFVGTIAGTLAWTFSVYDYNLYYDQGHAVERVLLVGLFVGSLWRPVLIGPFLALVYAIVHQFDHPVACTWTDKRVLFDVLSLFVAFLGVRLWSPGTWPKVTANDFLYLAVILQAANYFFPGLGKLVMGWPLIERLDNLFIASYLNGWLGFLTAGQALYWARQIADWNAVMVWSSLVLELATLFCLWNRRWCLFVLLSCIGLHAMICLTTGILFWKWIIFDAALIGLLAGRDRLTTEALFSPCRRWASVGLIAAAPFYFDPPWLAWYDTELNEVYHLEAVTAAGQTFNIPRTLMTPYEVYFAQNKFHFLSRDRFVNGRYGTTADPRVARRLDGTPTREVAESVRNELGELEYNPKKAAAFARFVQTYFANLNRRGISHDIPRAFHPPQHIYSVVAGPRFNGQHAVVQVRVIHERSLYQRDRIETIKRDVLEEIDIPAQGTGELLPATVNRPRPRPTHEKALNVSTLSAHSSDAVSRR